MCAPLTTLPVFATTSKALALHVLVDVPPAVADAVDVLPVDVALEPFAVAWPPVVPSVKNPVVPVVDVVPVADVVPAMAPWTVVAAGFAEGMQLFISSIGVENVYRTALPPPSVAALVSTGPAAGVGGFDAPFTETAPMVLDTLVAFPVPVAFGDVLVPVPVAFAPEVEAVVAWTAPSSTAMREIALPSFVSPGKPTSTEFLPATTATDPL